MAETTVNQLESEAWPSERVAVARQAIFQIDSLISMLGREQSQSGFEFVLASTVKRMKDLSSVVMSVMEHDDMRETSEMMDVVYGCALLPAAA